MKIAMIGAGSAIFAQGLMTDILSWPALQDATITLMDIDADRLELIGALADRLVHEQHLPARIATTTDRRAALEGADYVIAMIQVGGASASASKASSQSRSAETTVRPSIVRRPSPSPSR